MFKKLNGFELFPNEKLTSDSKWTPVPVRETTSISVPVLVAAAIFGAAVFFLSLASVGLIAF
jgi:hypothetical protein